MLSPGFPREVQPNPPAAKTNATPYTVIIGSQRKNSRNFADFRRFWATKICLLRAGLWAPREVSGSLKTLPEEPGCGMLGGFGSFLELGKNRAGLGWLMPRLGFCIWHESWQPSQVYIILFRQSFGGVSGLRICTTLYSLSITSNRGSYGLRALFAVC